MHWCGCCRAVRSTGSAVVVHSCVAAAPSLRCGLASADDGALVAVVDVGDRVAGRSGGRAVLFIVFKLKSRQQRCSGQHLTLDWLVNGVNLS